MASNSRPPAPEAGQIDRCLHPTINQRGGCRLHLSGLRSADGPKPIPGGALTKHPGRSTRGICRIVGGRRRGGLVSVHRMAGSNAGGLGCGSAPAHSVDLDRCGGSVAHRSDQGSHRSTPALKMGLRRSGSKLSRPLSGRQYSSGSVHRLLKAPHSTVPRQSHQCTVWLDQMNSACASSGLSVPARNGLNGR